MDKVDETRKDLGEPKYAVEKEGSILKDLNLSGGTKNGTFWASYIPESELIGSQVWLTDYIEYAEGLAMLVGGKVVKMYGFDIEECVEE